MSSSSDNVLIYAEPMLDTEEYLMKYIEDLKKLLEENVLPDLGMKLEYQVYTLKGGFAGHRSIIFTINDEQFFSVELTVRKYLGVERIYPQTKEIGKHRKSEMEHLGVIKATGNFLINKAIAVMKSFDYYFILDKNCQYFCNKYLVAIGLQEAQLVTDADIATKIAVFALIIAFLYVFLRWLDGTDHTAVGLTCIS